jgi:hypothetical protein
MTFGIVRLECKLKIPLKLGGSIRTWLLTDCSRTITELSEKPSVGRRRPKYSYHTLVHPVRRTSPSGYPLFPMQVPASAAIFILSKQVPSYLCSPYRYLQVPTFWCAPKCHDNAGTNMEGSIKRNVLRYRSLWNIDVYISTGKCQVKSILQTSRSPKSHLISLYHNCPQARYLQLYQIKLLITLQMKSQNQGQLPSQALLQGNAKKARNSDQMREIEAQSRWYGEELRPVGVWY